VRILEIAANFFPDHVGGVEVHLRSLAETLAARHEIAILHRTGDPFLAEFSIQETRVEGIPVFRLAHRFGRSKTFRDLHTNPHVDAAVGTLLDAWRPDLVHAHHFTTLSVSIAEEAAKRRIPLVVSLHDYWLGCPRGQMVRADGGLCDSLEPDRCFPCLRAMWPDRFGPNDGPSTILRYHDDLRGELRLASAIVAPSAFHRDRYVDFGLAAPDRMHVIPYGIPIPRGLAAPGTRRRGGSETGAFRFGFLGSVMPSKGVHVLLDAFRRFGRDESVALEIHGEPVFYHQDLTYPDRCREAASGDPRIRFHGRYEPSELGRILDSLDALVVPSIWEESYCITAREGFLAGIPVIVSDFGAIRSTIHDGIDALVVPRGDADALHRAMRRLLEAPALVRRLSEAPKKVPTVAENAARHEALYHQAAESRRAG
jgi:glycosyltransferase involved in cell wall biosynthesis